MITLAAQIAEARSALALRRACYPQWGKSGQLDMPTAHYQLQAMAAMVKTLERLEVDQRHLSVVGSWEYPMARRLRQSQGSAGLGWYPAPQQVPEPWHQRRISPQRD